MLELVNGVAALVMRQVRCPVCIVRTACDVQSVSAVLAAMRLLTLVGSP